MKKQDEPEEECLGLGNGPGSEGAGEDDNRRQQNHGHGDAVDTDGEVNVERREPGPAAGEEHGSRGTGGTQGEVVDKQLDAESDEGCGACHRHGANLLDVAAEGESCEHQQGNHHKPD